MGRNIRAANVDTKCYHVFQARSAESAGRVGMRQIYVCISRWLLEGHRFRGVLLFLDSAP